MQIETHRIGNGATLILNDLAVNIDEAIILTLRRRRLLAEQLADLLVERCLRGWGSFYNWCAGDASAAWVGSIRGLHVVFIYRCGSGVVRPRKCYAKLRVCYSKAVQCVV